MSVTWAEFDEKQARHQNVPIWEGPFPERLRWPNSSRIWHRIRGHNTRSRFDLLIYPSGWECCDCDLTVGCI